MPAARFEIKSRGVIRKGAFADVVVWSESEFAGRATYTSPHEFSSGIDYVVVNGVVGYRFGKFTGNRGGRFISR